MGHEGVTYRGRLTSQRGERRLFEGTGETKVMIQNDTKIKFWSG
jgi:hypothetical protein